jgi:hypothetical protein
MALADTLGTNMQGLAAHLQSLGRGKDRVLAHINPREVAMLKAQGGRGSINPHTGLLEFDDIPIEPVTVTGSAFSPSVDVSNLALPQGGAPAQPVEQVTSTANATPTSVTVPTDLNLARMQAPQLAAPTVAPAPQTVQAPALQAAPTFGLPTATPAIPGTAAPGVDTTQTADTGEVKPAQEQSFLGRNKDIISLLGLGGLGLYGGMQNARAGQQAQALQTNLAALAQPTQQAGQTALSTTLAGGLTPQNQQVLQATQGAVAQGQQRGAVSAQQAAEAVSNTYANLLTDQLNQALGLLNTADSYLKNAYLQGYQANVANQTNTTNFYSNLAQLAARLGGYGGTTINLGTGS